MKIILQKKHFLYKSLLSSIIFLSSSIIFSCIFCYIYSHFPYYDFEDMNYYFLFAAELVALFILFSCSVVCFSKSIKYFKQYKLDYYLEFINENNNLYLYYHFGNNKELLSYILQDHYKDLQFLYNIKLVKKSILARIFLLSIDSNGEEHKYKIFDSDQIEVNFSHNNYIKMKNYLENFIKTIQG